MKLSEREAFLGADSTRAQLLTLQLKDTKKQNQGWHKHYPLMTESLTKNCHFFNLKGTLNLFRLKNMTYLKIALD